MDRGVMASLMVAALKDGQLETKNSSLAEMGAKAGL